MHILHDKLLMWKMQEKKVNKWIADFKILQIRKK